MIGSLKGQVEAIGDAWAVIDVHGVGYHLGCSARTLGSLERADSQIKVFVETHLRDDRILLYGFAELVERDCFRVLHSVQGVSPRIALAILSVVTPEQVVGAIIAQDHESFTRASGVGKRLASRLITELKDRIDEFGSDPAVQLTGTYGEADNDAVLALINLGYSRTEASRAVRKARKDLGDDAGTSVLITACLKDLA